MKLFECKKCNTLKPRNAFKYYKSKSIHKTCKECEDRFTGFKICTKCGIEKPINEFYKDKRIKHEHEIYCKTCSSLKCKQYKDKHREGIRVSKIKRRSTLEGKFDDWKQSAKRRGIKWKLTIEDLKKLPLQCHYTKETLVFIPKAKNNASLDRVDSNKPYEIGNIVFCLSDINKMKRDFNIDYFVNLCSLVSRNKDLFK